MLKRARLLAWWFMFSLTMPSGATILGYPGAPPTLHADSAECERAREAKADELAALYRAGALLGFEVHECRSQDRAPR